MSLRAVITGTGHGLPSRVLTNKDLETMVDTTDDWIVQRTGIRERRVVGPGEHTGTLSLDASRQALAAAGVRPEEIDLVVCGTVSGVYVWPSTASYIQHEIHAPNAAAFDVSAACAGFVYGVTVVDAMIRAGQSKKALLVGVDTLSRQVDWSDRGTCVLFGDGAGAVVMEAREGGDRGVIESVLMSDGGGARHIAIEIGGTMYPYGSPEARGRGSCITMNGKEVYRFAVEAIGDACCRVLEKAGMSSNEVDLFVPHQANLRIIESAAKRLDLNPDRVFVNVERYGNTSGGSVPLALYEAEASGQLRPGMVVLTVGFGAGLVWGANLIRW